MAPGLAVTNATGNDGFAAQEHPESVNLVSSKYPDRRIGNDFKSAM